MTVRMMDDIVLSFNGSWIKKDVSNEILMILWMNK